MRVGHSAKILAGNHGENTVARSNDTSKPTRVQAQTRDG